MVWITLRSHENKVDPVKWLLQCTAGTLCILWPVMFQNMFWVLFLAVLIVVVAIYVGAQGGLFGRLFKNGVFGGIWLTIPLYAYLLPNT